MVWKTFKYNKMWMYFVFQHVYEAITGLLLLTLPGVPNRSSDNVKEIVNVPVVVLK